MNQRDFGWMQEVKPPSSVDDVLLGHCKTSNDAILLTWNTRRVKHSQAYASAFLGLPTSHLSNILSGKKYLPDDLRVPFMWFCGSLALRQFEDRQMKELGLDLELIEAERKLNELKARRAA